MPKIEENFLFVKVNFNIYIFKMKKLAENWQILKSGYEFYFY
jgi:hypothetical protein